MSFLFPKPPATPALPPPPAAPPPPPMFGSTQQPGSKPQQKSAFPSFLGSGTIPDVGLGQVGSKSLLGS
jgi:hypothetical protein